ncbi:TRAP transporter substrate-binding protein [Pseudonocardia sp. MH-G8]|uniref:TRAP transporter substrate-binding protein n=1 Tax=Pseudonocardia sp. MH-G8 TaxID=1854588 RepID=UPI000BA12D5C|nr:TRAP transporter substrate-binding protein [Pseudonocardia sp. MH-G8]OZM76899.1 hypothetical protein CFP66_38885 [Pseudonocardia sp. MH-G8]
MFTIRRSMLGVALLVMALTSASCAATGSTPAGVTTLTLGHTWSKTDANAEAVQAFADEVQRESGGSLRIEIYPSGQLGDDAEALEGLGLGTVDMWVGGSGVYSQMTPVGQFLVLPYLYDDIDDAMRHYNGDLGRAVQERISRDTRTRVLAFWPRGARHLTLNSAATTPQDIAGLRIRVPENPMILRSWQAFGASPTPMAFGDVLTALEQGALEGQENPLATIDSAGLSVAQSTLILTGHVIEPTAMSIGASAWERLDEGQRALLERIANGPVRDGLLDFVRSEETRLEGELAEDGMQVVRPDRAAFRDRVAGLAERAGPVVTELSAMAEAS